MTKRRTWIGGLAGAAVLAAAIVWAVGSVMTRGRPSPVPPAVAPARDLVLRTSDGVRIAATFRPGRGERAPGVLLLHGVNAARPAVAGNAAWLSDRGYATMAIDFRGHGRSDMAPRSFGLTEAADARASAEIAG